MALSATRLAAAIKTNIESFPEFTPLIQAQYLTDFCTAIANAIVTEITTNASVTAGIVSNGTVTSGVGVGGTVQTTSTLHNPGVI